VLDTPSNDQRAILRQPVRLQIIKGIGTVIWREWRHGLLPNAAHNGEPGQIPLCRRPMMVSGKLPRRPGSGRY